MSTFKGIVAEFPRIRVDYFRQQPGHAAPLACFLSHVHSDHLTGLEGLKAPFVYCSAATREILLRLERYHYRVNFARGILESRNVTYGRSISGLLKPLPLDTPTTIELAPGKSIRVTLIDANHCIGAVMFLFEADDKAALYTGDIRAEAWWVNSLVQNPALLPYTLGSRQLDCMYLDTTFATKSSPFREFASKAQGIKELLEKVAQYPDNTVFYFHSWTFGYENVWIALANSLHSRIHVDDYRACLYASLSTLDKKTLREAGLNVHRENGFLRGSGLEIREAPALCGFKYGNHIQPGCLTSNNVARLHSCERGMGCPVIDDDENTETVHIIPIVTRGNGYEINEVGMGGGKGDLDQKEELQMGDAVEMGKLMELCSKHIQDGDLLSKVLKLLQQTLDDGIGGLNLDSKVQTDRLGDNDEFSPQTLIPILLSHVSKSDSRDTKKDRTIKFPYSRHSSYSELCGLVDAFRPKDIFPCTVDEETWTPSFSMRSLFGEHCSESIFRHDSEMQEIYEARTERPKSGRRNSHGSQEQTQLSPNDTFLSPINHKRAKLSTMNDEPDTVERVESVDACMSVENLTNEQIPSEVQPVQPLVNLPISTTPDNTAEPASTPIPNPKSGQELNKHSPLIPTLSASISVSSVPNTSKHTNPSSKPRKWKNKEIAYNAALGRNITWADYGGLVCTRGKVDDREEEL